MTYSSTLHAPRPSCKFQTRPIDSAPLQGLPRHELERSVLEGIGGKARSVLRELFDYFRGRADCFVSNTTLANLLEKSIRHVQYALRELEAMEVIRIIPVPGIPSKRRIVLLQHPNALKVLKALGAIPKALARFFRDEPVSPAAPIASADTLEVTAPAEVTASVTLADTLEVTAEPAPDHANVARSKEPDHANVAGCTMQKHHANVAGEPVHLEARETKREFSRDQNPEGDRRKLEEDVQRLEAMSWRYPWQSLELKLAREALATLKALERAGGSAPAESGGLRECPT